MRDRRGLRRGLLVSADRARRAELARPRVGAPAVRPVRARRRGVRRPRVAVVHRALSPGADLRGGPRAAGPPRRLLRLGRVRPIPLLRDVYCRCALPRRLPMLCAARRGEKRTLLGSVALAASLTRRASAPVRAAGLRLRGAVLRRVHRGGRPLRARCRLRPRHRRALRLRLPRHRQRGLRGGRPHVRQRVPCGVPVRRRGGGRAVRGRQWVKRCIYRDQTYQLAKISNVLAISTRKPR